MTINSKNIPKKSKKQSLTDYAEILTDWYIDNTSPQYRKRRGQFFTPKMTCEVMVNQFTNLDNKENIRILDPGAGTGMFASAICEHFLSKGRLKRLTIDLYEKDSKLLPLLKANLNTCKRQISNKGIKISYNVYNEDFILSNSPIFNKEDEPFVSDSNSYDIVISNPPYYKIRKEAPQAVAMSKIVKGQPNIYSLFMALSAKLLKDGGQMTILTPRSYCSGLSFRQFRKWFFNNMKPIKLHVFDSRKEVFKKYNVLQEVLLLTAVKRGSKPKNITLSFSNGEFKRKSSVKIRKLAYDEVIIENKNDINVRILESKIDESIVTKFRKFKFSLNAFGLKVSTGPIVPFRTLNSLLKNVNGEKCSPLIRMQNIKDGKVIWPICLKNKHIAIKSMEDTDRFLVPNANYVLLKRFSSKEGRRRIDAGVLLKRRFKYNYIGIENHVNYIYRKDGIMTYNEVYGIATLLNTKLYNKYFQMTNGCTQVNVSAIKYLPLPSLGEIELIGKIARKELSFDEVRNERIVASILKINDNIINKLLDS